MYMYVQWILRVNDSLGPSLLLRLSSFRKFKMYCIIIQCWGY